MDPVEEELKLSQSSHRVLTEWKFGFGWICCGAGRKAAEVAFSGTAASPARAASSHEHLRHHLEDEEEEEEDEDGSLTSASVGGADSAVADVAPLQPVRKTAFVSHIKTNILPRQARDKHRENSKKGPFFLRRLRCLLMTSAWATRVRENGRFEPLINV
jgi:predicted PP-loop superfamily ATPase